MSALVSAYPAGSYAQHLATTMVCFEGAVMPLSAARSLYQLWTDEAEAELISSEQSDRIVRLWNAMCRADMRAKGLPLTARKIWRAA